METAFPQLEFVLATTGNVQTQVNNVEDLIAQQIDAPVILPLAEPVKAAKARGIFFQHQCDICCASSSDPAPDRNRPKVAHRAAPLVLALHLQLGSLGRVAPLPN